MISLVYFKDALLILFKKQGTDFFCFSTRWRCVSNCSWPGPAAIGRVFVQRFHLAQHSDGEGEGEGGAGTGFALPRPEGDGAIWLGRLNQGEQETVMSLHVKKATWFKE